MKGKVASEHPFVKKENLICLSEDRAAVYLVKDAISSE
jgi:hypothetical protein